MRTHVAVLLLAVGSSACNCNSKTHSANGQLQVPSTLDFGPACVKAPAPLVVVPAMKGLTVQNVGAASVTIATLAVDQGSPFSIADGGPTDLAAGQSEDLAIAFLPTGVGAVSAHLTVTDDLGNASSTLLTGSGSSASPDPVTLLHCPGGRIASDGGLLDQCYDWANQQTSPSPLLWFADTAVGSATDVAIVVSNSGCATLDVSSVALDAGTGAGPPFQLLDASGNPLVASYPPFSVPGGIGGTANNPIKVRFQPSSSSAFQGSVTLATNVPGAGTVSIGLLGIGVAPTLQLCATVGSTQACSTPTIPALCDFSATPACTGTFVATNTGHAAISLSGISLATKDSHFTLSGTPSLPVTLQATGTTGDSATFQIAYSPGTQSASDTLLVTSSGGNLQMSIQGGSPPQLVIVPAPGDLPDTVDFNRDPSGNMISLPNSFTGSKTFQLKNTGTGRMSVQSVFFRDTGSGTWPMGAPYPYFQVTPPPSGTIVNPGATADVVVQFTDPPDGVPTVSPFMTTVEVDTDDPLWPPASGGKPITILAKTPCNPPPVAVVTGPTTVVLKGSTVTLDGSTSYDTDPDSTGSCSPGLQCTASNPPAGCRAQPIRHFDWELLSVSADAGTVTLNPSGLGTSSSTQLTLGNCSMCSYMVTLVVYDDTPPTVGMPNGHASTAFSFTVNAQ